MLRTSGVSNTKLSVEIRNTQHHFSKEPWGMADWIYFTPFMHFVNLPLTWAFALFQFCQSCWQYYTHEKTDAYRCYSESLTHLNMVFTVLFSIECILKLLAFGPKVWSRLDSKYPVNLMSLMILTLLYYLLFSLFSNDFLMSLQPFSLWMFLFHDGHKHIH